MNDYLFLFITLAAMCVWYVITNYDSDENYDDSFTTYDVSDSESQYNLRYEEDCTIGLF